MTEIQETRLPGVGIRHDFVTKAGNRIGMISHRGGRRDLLIYDQDDPDTCQVVVRLEEEDSHALAELLGASHVAGNLVELQQSVEGLTIDWLPISSSWACEGRTIQETQLRAETGLTIIAIIRDGQTIPMPPPDFRLQAEDTAVVIGTPDAIQHSFTLLQEGHQ